MTGALLEVDNISVSFDGFKAINALSFNVFEGELRAIIGPNGAGKTTFMDIVTGKTKPDTGKIMWGEKNENLLRFSEAQIARRGIGRKFQKPTVFEDQSVFDNLAMSLKDDRSPFAVLFNRITKDAQKRIEALAIEIGLADQITRLAGELSHGQKQWLEIGMLLAQEPRLLLVDEPAAGMTLEERNRTVKLLREAAKTRAVVVVEHDMDFVRNLDCKVTVLHEGAVLAEGSIDHVTQNKDVIDVYLGR
ncbi:MAG: urea ABC transporter ATP-binding protein UrtD [Pseudomonadota bacterium]